MPKSLNSSKIVLITSRKRGASIANTNMSSKYIRT